MAARKRKQKNMPEKTNAATYSPSAEAVQPPAWQVVGAAVKGVSHQRLGLPCQDAQGFRLLPDGTLLVALADGAGSARFSDQGAQRAVEAGLDALAEGLQAGPPVETPAWESLLRQAFLTAREAVLRLAEESLAEDADHPAPARAFACTLTLTVAAAERLVAGQVGDGAVVAAGAVDGEGEDLFSVTHLQRGEYANETHFLTQEDALDRLTIEVIERPVRGFAVMSDGLIRLALKMPGQEPHAPFFVPLFRFAGSLKAALAEQAAEPAPDAEAQLASFLDSERVNARTDDDKSLVLAVRAAAGPPVLDRESE